MLCCEAELNQSEMIDEPAFLWRLELWEVGMSNTLGGKDFSS